MILVFSFLVGCTNTPKKETASIADTIIQKENDSVVEKKTDIAPKILYLLLTAEIAGQRNQYSVALDGYLQAAKQVDDARISERAAKIGLYLKDTKKTDEAVSLWLKQDGENLTARKIAVLSALRNNNKTAVVEHLSEILAKDPAGVETTLVELTQVLDKEGKAGFMFEVLEDLSSLHPEQSVVYFVQALVAGQRNKLDIALEKINKALHIQPDWNKAGVLKAQLATQKGDLILAKEVLESILDKIPENDQIKKMLAQVLMKSDQFDRAIELYQSILSNQPEDEGSRFALVLILLQQNKDDEAMEHLSELINKPRWNAQASFYSGRIEYKKENYQKALVWFDKVTQGEYVYDASMAAISVLLNQKEFAEAEQRLKLIMARYPKEHLNISLLNAELFVEQKNYQKAFAIMAEALEKSPENRDLLYTRSLIAEKLDKLDVVEADLKKIILKNPEDYNALNALGYTLADRTQRYAEAEVYLQKAITLKPDETVIIDSVGWLQFKKGNLDAALALLLRAYDKSPENEIVTHLTEILWVKGDKEKAKEIFADALKKSPENKYILKLLKRFPELMSQ
ncbi:MAG: tetratricopeptide repeat protein [Methylococcales symbiont of Iophon sp. n. MRB-2018]|nr:MAG: tetratricopeptide repeat protein [Methylococcales symbiont of Iophon sp. n. MRB-2018]KAF3978921.1 MAG: tetratricopeptide repeat protein [Methylococcales symbiont of Iophon sp. n. MRB-2018]